MLATVGLIFLAGCGESGACVQALSSGSVAEKWCYEAEHESQCPVLESGDEGSDFRWEFTEGKSCPQVEFEFDCGEGIFEDLESQCGLWQGADA